MKMPTSAMVCAHLGIATVIYPMRKINETRKKFLQVGWLDRELGNVKN